jgi:hypothetical protein
MSSCLAFAGRVSESKIRLVGLFLQLGGVATVAWGLRETRQFFGYPTLFQHAIDWVRRFPRYKPPPISAAIDTTFPAFHVKASGYSWQSFGPEAPIEKRLAAVEANRLDVNGRLGQVQQQLHSETHRIK